jgi:hypothetical protein
LFISFGCASFYYTPLDKNWGKSFERAKVSQELDSEASSNLDLVTGLDGQAAEGNMEKYRKAHKAEKGGKGGGVPFMMGTFKGLSGK